MIGFPCLHVDSQGCLQCSSAMGLKNCAVTSKVIKRILDPRIQTYVAHLIFSELYRHSEWLAIDFSYPHDLRVSLVDIVLIDANGVDPDLAHGVRPKAAQSSGQVLPNGNGRPVNSTIVSYGNVFFSRDGHLWAALSFGYSMYILYRACLQENRNKEQVGRFFVPCIWDSAIPRCT
jgi:hypothetical protein